MGRTTESPVTGLLRSMDIEPDAPLVKEGLRIQMAPRGASRFTPEEQAERDRSLPSATRRWRGSNTSGASR